MLAGPALAGAQAQDSATSDIPGFAPLAPGATLSYLISGELEAEIAAGSHLVVERIALDAGDVVPTLETGQILIVESGELSLIDDLGLEVTLEARTQFFVASDGYRDLTATVDSRLLRASISAAAEPAATLAPDVRSNATTLLDQELDTIDPGATLFVAEVELAGNGGSLGEQTYNGMTGMIATGAPLTVERPNHLPAKLPEEQALFFPAGTVATVTNAASPTATLVIAGVVEPATTEGGPPTTFPESGAGTPTADEGQPSRPTTRDGQPAETTSLEAYLPSDNDAGPAGFVALSTEPNASVADSIFNGLASEPDGGGWEAGLTRVYLPIGEWADVTAALVSADQFDTAASAANAVMLFAVGSAIIAEPFDPPASATADQVVGFTMDVPDESATATFIMAQYGDVVVTTMTIVPLNEEGEPAAIALWQVVDAINS